MPSTSSAPDQPAVHHTTRRLDAVGLAVVLMLCVSWSFNQVAIKLAGAGFPPMIQATLRSVIAAIALALWCWFRGIPLFQRDGTLKAGLLIGLLFSIQFVLLYHGLTYTTASRSTVFLYLAPFFVVLGSRIFLPADRFSPWQWAGLALSFIGMVVAFGLPTPALDPRQTLGDMMVLAAAVFWGGTTLTSKASRLNKTYPEKVVLYELAVSAPILSAVGWLYGERMTQWPSVPAIGWLAYQAVWVVAVTFVLWFAIIKRYSASRVSAFTVLTPLLGVGAGHVIIGDPVTPAFLAAVALVVAGLALVNRPR